MKNTRLVIIATISVIVLLLSTTVFADQITRVVHKGRGGIYVHVSCGNVQRHLGCSYWDSNGVRHDIPSRAVAGVEAVYFPVPNHVKYTVALWRTRYLKNTGPDPNNAWGLRYGYYLFGELQRITNINKD